MREREKRPARKWLNLLDVPPHTHTSRRRRRGDPFAVALSRQQRAWWALLERGERERARAHGLVGLQACQIRDERREGETKFPGNASKKDQPQRVSRECRALYILEFRVYIP